MQANEVHARCTTPGLGARGLCTKVTTISEPKVRLLSCTRAVFHVSVESHDVNLRVRQSIAAGQLPELAHGQKFPQAFTCHAHILGWSWLEYFMTGLTCRLSSLSI